MNDDELQNVKNFRDDLDKVKTSLIAIDSKNISTVRDSLNDLEKAKLHVTIAYSLATVYHLLLKSSGNSSNHPLYKELSKVQSVVENIRKIEGNMGNIKEGRSVVIDKQASKRIVKHQISLNYENKIENRKKIKN